MFSLKTIGRQPSSNGDATYEPLLEDSEHQNNVVFSVEDDEEEANEHAEYEEGEAHDTRTRTVRFQEDVRVIGPPLRSTIASRETGKNAVAF